MSAPACCTLQGKWQMAPDEIRKAREQLGLTQAQLGSMLELDDPDGREVRRMESDAGTSRHRQLPKRAARLIEAYLRGYRPKDWPA
jgi:ribosome-binding protein aMBF1 (putative translation factor)